MTTTMLILAAVACLAIGISLVVAQMWLWAAVTFGALAIGVAIRALYRQSRMRDRTSYGHLIILWVVAIAIAIAAAYSGVTAYNGRSIEPPPAEAPPAADPTAFPAVDLDRDALDDMFVGVSHYLSTSSMSQEAADRVAAIKDGYGVVISDALGYPLCTEAEITEIAALKDAERQKALEDLRFDAQKAGIEGIVGAYADLEWLAGEDYFTTNNPWIVELYGDISRRLSNPTPDETGRVGWSQYLTVESKPDGTKQYRIEDELWYGLARVEAVFNYANIRGIETLTSTAHWYLPEGQDNNIVHAVREDDPKRQVTMPSLIYDFSHKNENLDGAGSTPKYLVGHDTADRRLEIYEINAKEPEKKPETTKPPAEKPQDNKPSGDESTGNPGPTIVTPDPEPVYYTVSERFVDEYGREILKSRVQPDPVEVGKPWSSRYEKITGYSLISTTTNDGRTYKGANAKSPSGTMPSFDLVVTYKYEAQDARLRVRYRATDGAKVPFRDVDTTVEIGKEYSVPSPEWKGYTPDIKEVYGKRMPAEGVDVIVTYSPDQVKVNITIQHIVYRTGRRVPGLSDTKVRNQVVGSIYYYDTPYADGYIAHNVTEAIKIREGQTVYEVYYDKLPPDGEGAKNPNYGPTNQGNADTGGGDNTPASDHTSDPQPTEPAHQGGNTVTTQPDGTPTETHVDSSGPSGAGSESTTPHDTTGTGAATDPTVTNPGADQVNGGTPPPLDTGLGSLPSSTVTTETTTTTPSGDQTTTTVTTQPDNGMTDGVVGDID